MPIYEYECASCGAVTEFFEGMAQENRERQCRSCGGGDLHKILSKGVAARMGGIMGSQGGKTCCGREERCETSPCAQGQACHR
ncbi:MAG: zinc ribbon domain-containing protein [Deltaproteobacteria bacterium]|nr:zinc ribbon domain-containing protein [Deltaproteobacteria bacterium]